MALILIGLLAALIAFTLINIYNSLVKLKVNVENGWAQIDVQLKRRHDLIPNLVETAKGYMAHEKDTLEGVIKARQQAVDAKGLENKQQAENFLSGTLRSLFAVTERYPDLKADRQMMQLHEELTSTENKIAFSRQYYNDEVGRLNTTIQTFPDNMVAGMFNFGKAEFFELEDQGQREAPKVKF